jgi:hypothetical protein
MFHESGANITPWDEETFEKFSAQDNEVRVPVMGGGPSLVQYGTSHILAVPKLQLGVKIKP